MGCLIPPLSLDEQRVLEMRGMLIRLEGLGIGGEILRMYGATKEDLEMMAVVEGESQDGRSKDNNNSRG